MSSTRHQTTPGPLRQERYASSPEIERGLLASAVARRCSVLHERADRELIWWLHFMSHQPGGLKALVTELLASYPERIGTAAMLRIGRHNGNYSADQMCEIREDLPGNDFARRSARLRSEAARAVELRRLAEFGISHAADERPEPQSPEGHPDSASVNAFNARCKSAAVDGLEDHLRKLCLDPGTELAACAPWYFADLIPTLRVFMSSWIARRAAGIVVTALGRKVHETLDYTLHSRTMTLMEGDARTGKSFAVRFWCEQHPGQARFIEVPTGNDAAGFYRALARGLGLGSFQQYKASEICERVERVLLTGDVLVCLDEAHRLWPEVNLWRGFPKRINWVMSMANQRVPICMVATP